MPYRARALALAFAAILSVGAVPGLGPELAAASTPKVAIIVGPTGITDSHYHPWAKDLKKTAEAAGATVDLRYCPTPAQAKAATDGANIIVYFGHGNGFPNPYSQSELTDRVNGFGLRHPGKSWDKTSCTDAVLQYYGEDHLTGKITTNGWGNGGLTPAPNFVMVMSNACYAPGAGESRPAPAQSVALERVANYSTPFLELGGTYFATDLGSAKVVDLILRNPSTAFGTLFEQGNGYDAAALKRHPHPDFAGQEAWVHRTKNQWLGDDYWYAFAGDPGRAPNGSTVGYTALVTLPFTDIADSRFIDNILWVTDHGYMSGCTASRFCPKARLSRGQLASALAAYLSLPPAPKDYFADDNGSPHEDAINRVRAANLMGGCGGGHFCLDQDMRRGPLARIMVRALDLPAATKDHFTDDDGTGHEPYINSLASAGIALRCGVKLYCAGHRIMRHHGAVILNRAFD